MKTAILYKRVSTDEQAFGFSLIDQDKRLTEYCERNGILIAASFKDDFTGKTFNRPGFNQLLSYLNPTKATNPTIDLLLFTKWSRFSRNTAESYQMIKQLLSMGVEVQAIDEPFDASIPQNLVLKAIQLAIPEMDNLIRSDNTTRGMRRSMKQGRYCATAPQGYVNARDDNNKPILKPDPVKSKLIQKMFDLLATGQYSQQEVRRTMEKQGLKYSRAQFGNAIRNKIYISKLSIPAYKGEPEEIVNGLHTPLIDEGTFYRVQAVIAGKSRQHKVTSLSEEMPLRGFLFCTHDHKMTGSCSHGHGGNYHYYHCPNILCERYRADTVNKAYIKLLESYRLEPEIAEIIEELSLSMLKPEPQVTSALQQQIKAQEQRIQVLQDKYIDGTITPTDYQQIRTRYESQLFDLKQKLSELTITERELTSNFGDVTKLLVNLPDLFREAKPDKKREIISSITPGKLYFENKIVRTSETNSAISLIANIDKGFSQSNILHSVQYDPDVRGSDPSHTLSRTLQTDIKLLSDLFKRVA